MPASPPLLPHRRITPQLNARQPDPRPSAARASVSNALRLVNPGFRIHRPAPSYARRALPNRAIVTPRFFNPEWIRHDRIQLQAAVAAAMARSRPGRLRRGLRLRARTARVPAGGGL